MTTATSTGDQGGTKTVASAGEATFHIALKSTGGAGETEGEGGEISLDHLYSESEPDSITLTR